MPRFYLAPEAWSAEPLALDAAESHHALDVLRLQTGDRATIFDGQGTEADVEVIGVSLRRVQFRTLQQTSTPRPRCEITLAQAIPKGKTMEFIIEKATELGATKIVPLLSARTVVQIGEKDAERKREKWRRVALEAAKQCGCNWPPAVQTPVRIEAFFDRPQKSGLMLIASLQPGARHLKSVLAEHGPQNLDRVLVLVGPEGDLTPAEVALATNSGCRPITLGPIILRCDTAAIYCLSILSHELLNVERARS